MKKLLAFMLGCVPAMAGALQGPYECRYSATCSLPLEIYETDGVLPYTGTAPSATDDFWWHCVSSGEENKTSISSSLKDAGTFAYRILVSSPGTVCDVVKIVVRDEDGPGNAYLSTAIAFETCGDASAKRRYCSQDIPALITSDGNPINATAGIVDQVTLVTTTTTNTDMRGTDGASTHTATDIVTGGAIATAAGAVTDVTNLESLNTTARSQIETEALQAQSAHRLNELVVNGLTAQPVNGSLWGDLTEDSPITPGTQRFNAQALAEAPSGGGGGTDVNVIEWGGVPLATTNPLPDAAPGASGGLPTVNATAQLAQPVSAYEVTDKSGYQANVVSYDAGADFNANQATTIQTQSANAINNARLNELVQQPKTAQPAIGSIYGDLTQDSTTIPGTQQFTADALAQAPTAAQLNQEAIRNALGAFGATVQTIQDPTNFVVGGTNVPTSAGDLIDQEYTVVFINAADGNSPSCHRQIQGFSAPTGLLTIPTACTQNVAINDEVIFLPNGAGAEIAQVTVNNGQVEVDQTQVLETGISAGCAQAAILAVQTGEQTITGGGTIYEYLSRDGLTTRVQATRSAAGRTQATITCPPGL